MLPNFVNTPGNIYMMDSTEVKPKHDVSLLKISEVAKITGVSIPLISRHFKTYGDNKVTRINNRVVGLSPTAVKEYLETTEYNWFYKPAIILLANLCGGVGKTTATNNLGASLQRFTTDPIVYVDGDSQGSFTTTFFGKPADDDESILIDFLENKVTIDDILTKVKENVYFVKSNLNQVWLEKVITKPSDIKKFMLRFYEAIFEKLGPNTKILQDHTPQLSNLFASSICALHQLPEDIIKVVAIPMRADKYAIQGGDYIIKEINEIKETYSFSDNIDIHCFFSNLDRRNPTTGDAIKLASQKEGIVNYLSSVAIRYSSEIPKSIMGNSNVYNTGKIVMLPRIIKIYFNIF